MSNAHEPTRPSFRLVEKTALPPNPTQANFADYLIFETGGTVVLDESRLVEEYGDDPRYWKIYCYSFDGGGPAYPVNAVFPKSGCLTAEQIEEQIRLYGNG